MYHLLQREDKREGEMEGGKKEGEREGKRKDLKIFHDKLKE